MTTVDMVEAIKVLTETLQILMEVKRMTNDSQEEMAKVIRDKILDYVKHI